MFIIQSIGAILYRHESILHIRIMITVAVQGLWRIWWYCHHTTSLWHTACIRDLIEYQQVFSC